MSNPNHYSKWDKLDYGSDEDDKRKKGAFKKSGDGDPMKTEVDGTPFDVLMQQAVKMKTAQTAPGKKKFETWPRFYQNSVFSKEDVVAARLMDFDGRKEVAEKKKENGNDLLKKGKQMDANYQYEQCLAIWKWAENTDPDWKNKGMKDEDLVENHFLEGGSVTDDQRTYVSKYLLACYLNIALASDKMGEYSVAIEACDAAIDIDERNCKAYYRRATARLAPASAGGLEQDMALKDLNMAKKFGGDASVVKKLRSLQGEMKKQKAVDKEQFNGMFNRGEIYDENGFGIGNENSPTIKKKDDPIEQQIMDAEQLVAIYERQEKFEQAKDLKEKIAETKRQQKEMLKKARKKGMEAMQNMDFRNPTKEMVEDAKVQGIDLTDKRVVEMLSNMQDEKMGGGGGGEGEEGRKDYDTATRGKLLGLIDELTKRQLVQALGEMGEGVDSSTESEDTLREKLIDALINGKEFPKSLFTQDKSLFSRLMEFLGNNSTKVAVAFGLLSALYNFNRMRIFRGFGAGEGAGDGGGGQEGDTNMHNIYVVEEF